MGMTIDNVLEILEKHKLHIPSNVFYELKADIVNFEMPTTKNDCEHCSKTYGTLGCCDTVSNEWVYSCKEGHEEYARGLRKYESTTKNDLGVDCISRKVMHDLGATCIAYRNNKQELISIMSIDELPSVTPQEPKIGHWKLVQRGKNIDICCSNCKAVRIKGYAYNYTIDQLDKENLMECFECADMRYCTNCGARMVEPQESEQT